MSKKILSAVLALVFVMSLFTVSAFAVGETAVEAEGTAYYQEWSLSQPETNGTNGEYKVYVTLEANYTVGAIQFVAAPAKGNAELVDVELNSDVFTADYNADVSYNPTKGKVVIIPKPKTASVEGIKNLGEGKVIATLTYNLINGAASENIAIVNEPKTATDPDGSLIAARLDGGTLTTATMYYGQNVTVGAGVTIGAAAAAPSELVVKEGTNGVIDTDYMCVYGIDVMDAGQTIGDVFEVTNGGYIEVTPNESYGAEEGTGAILTAYSANDEVIGEYTVVIHGDINGDGSADTFDAGILCDYEIGVFDDFSGFGISDEIAMLAGDVNGDGSADTFDAGYMFDFEIGSVDYIFDITTLPQALYDMW